MMLSLKTLKKHLQSKPTISLQELQVLLQEDSEMICCLLKYFIDRGQVEEKTLTPHCGVRCQKCPISTTRLFSWRAGRLNECLLDRVR